MSDPNWWDGLSQQEVIAQLPKIERTMDSFIARLKFQDAEIANLRRTVRALSENHQVPAALRSSIAQLYGESRTRSLRFWRRVRQGGAK